MESGRSGTPTELDIESDYFDSDSPMHMNGSCMPDMPDTPPEPVLPVLEVEEDSGTARSAAAPDLSFGGPGLWHLGPSFTGAHEHPGLDWWSALCGGDDAQCCGNGATWHRAWLGRFVLVLIATYLVY